MIRTEYPSYSSSPQERPQDRVVFATYLKLIDRAWNEDDHEAYDQLLGTAPDGFRRESLRLEVFQEYWSTWQVPV